MNSYRAQDEMFIFMWIYCHVWNKKSEELILINSLLQTMCTESDLKDLGLPMGPRKKLLGILKEEQAKQVTVLSLICLKLIGKFSFKNKSLCFTTLSSFIVWQEKRKHDKERRSKEAEERRIREQVEAELRETKAVQDK